MNVSTVQKPAAIAEVQLPMSLVSGGPNWGST